MRGHVVKILLLLSVEQVSSCSGYEAVSTIKFITNHGFSIERMPSWYLIHTVKQSSWTIHYGFSDNNYCHSSGVVNKGGFEQQLKASIIKAVELWLQPLRDGNNNIVNKFELKLKETVPVVEKDLSSKGVTKKVALEEDEDQEAHLRITFDCMGYDGSIPEGRKRYPRSFVMLGTVPQVFMFHYRSPAVVCDEESADDCVGSQERDQSEIFPHDKMSDEHMFMMTTLLHELGHTFGLKDVYIETDKKVAEERLEIGESINHSLGGSEKTVGKQPESIMGVASLIGLREMNEEEDKLEFFITTDDIEAIKWLYLQAHEGVALSVCPTDYEMEKETDGCVPRYPLIFAVREGDSDLVDLLLQDGGIDLDSCDRYGNTALYYAQQGKHGHGDDIKKALLDAGANADRAATCNAVPQPKASPVVETKTKQIDASEQLSSLTDEIKEKLKQQLSCSTLAHHDVSSNKLLLLLLLLPLLPYFPSRFSPFNCQ